MGDRDMRLTTVHELKLKEQYVRPILEGRLRYQIRFDDRGYQAGDLVRFRVTTIGLPVDFEYCTKEEASMLSKRFFRVDYVTATAGIAPGYVAFTITESRAPAGVGARERFEEGVL